MPEPTTTYAAVYVEGGAICRLWFESSSPASALALCVRCGFGLEGPATRPADIPPKTPPVIPFTPPTSVSDSPVGHDRSDTPSTELAYPQGTASTGKSARPRWKNTRIQSLYEYRPAGLAETARGVYYSRICLGGKRTFRSLDTSVFEHAKILHAQRMVEVEKDRQRGADLGSGFKTLGALMDEMKRRHAANPKSEATTVAREDRCNRLREHWQRGAFDTFLARNVTADVIESLREHLLGRAEWSRHRGGVETGFSVRTANQTLWVLRSLLDLAVEKKTIVESPFTSSTALRASLFASERREDRKALALPSRAEMAAVFAEMRKVPDSVVEERRAMAAMRANELADHAELLAFSGMRRDEAQRSLVSDDAGEQFKIRGTKSETSDRSIPVNPALRQVLDRIKARRTPGDPAARLLVYDEPRQAMNRACVRLGMPAMNNHRLRHYFASVCIASGVDVPTVSRWLGHADGGALAMRTYSHLLKDTSQAAAAKVDFNAPAVRFGAG